MNARRYPRTTDARAMAERFIYVAAALALLILMSVLDGPTESDAAAAVALDKQDAITSARVAAKERQ